MKIPKNIPLDKTGQYCLQCFANDTKEITKNGLKYYHCASCGQSSERCLIISNKIHWWVDKKTGVYWHESVGVLVIHNGMVLFFEHVAYPFVLTIPAGHLDVGETPEEAAKRELQEETSIRVAHLRLCAEGDIDGDKCRGGADNHRWHLYTVHLNTKPNVIINDEGENPVWMTLEQSLRENLGQPVRFFIEKYGDKLLQKNDY